jgi:hypothetical protein
MSATVKKKINERNFPWVEDEWEVDSEFETKEMAQEYVVRKARFDHLHKYLIEETLTEG